MKALVIGASGAVGEATARALCERGWDVRATMRRRNGEVAARLTAAGATIAMLDLAQNGALTPLAQGCDALVSAVDLRTSAAALQALASGPRRVLVFSSNNVAIDPAAATYAALAAAEQAVRTQYPDALIVRPTLIYGDPRLAALTQLMRLARHSPLLPLPGSGRARLQPVYYEDLGALAAGLIETGAAGGVYAAGGPDVVTFRELYRWIAAACGSRSAPVSLPKWALRLGAALLRDRFPLGREQIDRADLDRLSVAVTQIPPGLAPSTSLERGLARLATALGCGAPVRLRGHMAKPR